MRNHSRQSKSFTERRRRRAIVGGVSAVVALATWMFVLSRLSYIPAIAISDVSVYGTDAELVPVMNAAALETMSGAYAGLFSKANAFIYPQGFIAKVIASTSPRVDRVSVRRAGFRSLAVSVTEKTPDGIVCADLPDLSDDSISPSSRCYLADSRGFIFRPAKGSEFGLGNRFYMPDIASSGTDLSGMFATTTERWKKLQSLVNAIKNAGIGVEATLIKGSDIEIYANNPSGHSIVVIKMSERAPLEVQKENLIAFWSKMLADSRAKKTPLEWSEIKLQYPPNVYSRSIGEEATR